MRFLTYFVGIVIILVTAVFVINPEALEKGIAWLYIVGLSFIAASTSESEDNTKEENQ